MHPAIFPYQAEGARFLAERPFALLADDMGVGKTIQAIAACDLIGAQMVLVVCPAIARVNWVREFERWQTVPRTAGAVVKVKDRPVTAVVVVSFNGAATDTTRRWLEKRYWDVLIVDEAHALKNPATKRTKAIYGGRCERVTGLARHSARVWVLTGTPAPNNPSELWPHLFAGGATKLKLADFVTRYCNTYDDGFKLRITGAKKSALGELVGIMRPVTLRRKLEAVQKDLPPIRYAHVVLSPDKLPPSPDLPAEARLVLASVEAKLRGGDLALTADETMHLATLRRWTALAKVPAIAELILEELEQGKKKKLVVFAIHRDVLRDLRRRIGEHDTVLVDGDTSPTARQSAIDTFQSKAVPRVFLGQLTACATAVTLTAAHDVLFAEVSWTPSDLAQAAKRCHRIGQTRPVLARAFSLSGSIDERLTEAVTRKMRDISLINQGITTESASSL